MFNGRIGIEARSAGICVNASTPLSKSLIDWADTIFAMEPEHTMRIVEIVPEAVRKTITLNIPDWYEKNDPKLKAVLARKVNHYLKIRGVR